MSDNSVDWEERALRAEAKLALRTGEADAKTTIIKELEAKLVKAVEALEFYTTQDVAYPNVGTVTFHGSDDNGRHARTVLAELKGGAK